MKLLNVLWLLLFISTGALAQSWPPTEVKGNPGRHLAVTYGARYTGCYSDTDADLFSTTVDQDSAAAAKNLFIAATTDLVAGDVVVAHPGGAREEACIVDTVDAGNKVVCLSNLTFTHTAVQADPVVLTNRLPATGSTGFLLNRWYVIGCFDSAGAGVSCKCKQGGAAVDASISTQGARGERFAPGEKASWQFMSAGRFLSCIPDVDGAIVQVCLQDY